jgi:RNA polymerase sigma factor (sigma-70 family)
VNTDADDGSATRPRPNREETFAAAVELATRGSGRFKRFARRYSLCAADAEDAYQRSLEILLEKAPTTDRGELGAWLHTVIKHEALALRRQRERALGAPGELVEPAAEAAPALDEQASGRERVRQTAEALTHLKPNELECLLLKALGFSYEEIAERTGYSWTKVNRSLTEGRRRFLERFGQLSLGERCDEFQALLSTACDGEASAAEERTLRAHLDRCGSCRAALRGYRAAPRRMAELFPPGMLAGLSQQQNWWSRVGDWLSVGAGERAGALGWKLQQSAEAITAHKAAAVVASTAAIAGGAVVHEHPRLSHPTKAAHERTATKVRAAGVAPAPAPAPVRADPPAGPAPTVAPPEEPAESQPAEEFAPVPAADSPPRATAAEFGGPSSGGGGGGRGGEFGP